MNAVHGARSVWLLAAPLIAASSVVAHALAYRLTGEDAGVVAADDTHGYLAHLPLLVAPALAAGLAGLALRVLATRRGERAAAPPWTPFALAPGLGFFLQEQLERLAHGNGPAVEATLAVGLALSLPLGLAAFVVMRALLASADRAALALAAPREWIAPRRPSARVATAPDVPLAASAPLLPTERGPPPPLAV